MLDQLLVTSRNKKVVVVKNSVTGTPIGIAGIFEIRKNTGLLKVFSTEPATDERKSYADAVSILIDISFKELRINQLLLNIPINMSYISEALIHAGVRKITQYRPPKDRFLGHYDSFVLLKDEWQKSWNKKSLVCSNV
jgi:hypothetical protein